VSIQFPAKLQPLFDPWRYKVIHGGRGGAKSWGVARALLLQAAAKPLRILCTREVQNSIRESVHKLLSDQIAALGLSAFFTVGVASIKGRNGSEFMFAGLSDQTADSVKSYEGVDVVWCEEAHGITDRSWKILIPTIRKDGSEIWATFNPELDSDPTWVRFVVNKPANAVVIEMNHRDNPWFPQTLEIERLHDQRTLPADEYENIWEGKTRAAVAGAIYAKEITQAQLDRRIRPVPYDPMLKVHVVFDLGWNDAMTIAMVQRAGNQMMVIDYIEDSHRTYDHYSAELRTRKWNWGKVWLPHDGKHKNAQTGKSAADVMAALGWSVGEVPEIGLEQGIRVARMAFGRFYFDEDKTGRLVECLKRYRRRINQQTKEAGEPLHDEYSHGADVFRYAAVAADQMQNEEWGGAMVAMPVSIA